MSETQASGFGRTIQLYLVDGTPNGLRIASINGWTGTVVAATESTFEKLLQRPEVSRTGLYVLQGPDPEDGHRNRIYIGEANNVRERIIQSAAKQIFWNAAVVVVTADKSLSKGHACYLEARLIETARQAGRTSLANTQMPPSELNFLPEADRNNMEAFIANLRIVFPIVGFDFFKPTNTPARPTTPHFEIHTKNGVAATAFEEDGEFIVTAGSKALKDAGYKHNAYIPLKRQLIERGILQVTPDGEAYVFTKAHTFTSASAASSVLLDRTSNGRSEWKLAGGKETYEDWQKAKALMGRLSK